MPRLSGMQEGIIAHEPNLQGQAVTIMPRATAGGIFVKKRHIESRTRVQRLPGSLQSLLPEMTGFHGMVQQVSCHLH